MRRKTAHSARDDPGWRAGLLGADVPEPPERIQKTHSGLRPHLQTHHARPNKLPSRPHQKLHSRVVCPPEEYGQAKRARNGCAKRGAVHGETGRCGLGEPAYHVQRFPEWGRVGRPKDSQEHYRVIRCPLNLRQILPASRVLTRPGCRGYFARRSTFGVCVIFSDGMLRAPWASILPSPVAPPKLH